MTDASGGLAERLAPRAQRRPAPRVGVTMAAAGSGLVVLGALVESGNQLPGDSGSLNRWPGVVICSVVLVAGLVVLTKRRRGPIATAAVAATALILPPLLGFITLDEHTAPPFSVEAVLLLPTIVWLVLYVAGPSRGHGLYLGAALIGLWLFVLEEAEGVLTFPFALPSLVLGDLATTTTTDSYRAVPRSYSPSVTNLGAISLVFGIAYLLAMRALDRRGQRGMATPFVVGGLAATFSGVLFLSDDLEELGTGLLLLAVGFALALLGSLGERRLTTWYGGGAALVGAVVIAGKLADGNADVAAALLVAAGLAMVAGAHGFARAFHEPDETVEGPSTFRSGDGDVPPVPPATLTPF